MSERQWPKTWADARWDHRQRYAWADVHALHERGVGVDVFCGAGYGTSYLAREGRTVIGIDGDQEAINWATEHFYVPDHCEFTRLSWPDELQLNERRWDFAVCLESVEHVDDGIGLIQALARSLKVGGILVYSTPNQDLLPKLEDSFPHHVRHYPLAMILSWGDLDVQADTGSFQLHRLAWAGQDVYDLHDNGRVRAIKEEPIIKPLVPGQFIIVAAQRIK